MDYKLWKHNINNLNIPDNIKDTIITFFKNFKLSNSLDFITIDKSYNLKALNNINNYKHIMVCMDAEFQESITKLKYVRELGMLFFIRDNNKLYHYIGFIFVNFQSITKSNVDINNMRALYSTYSTVTKNTLIKMENNESVLLLENIVDPLNNKKLFLNHNVFFKKVNEVIEILKNNYIYKNILNEKMKKSIMVNFDYLKMANNFKSVEREIKIIQKKLAKTKFEIYGLYLKDTELYNNFLKTHKLYWDDDFVIDRLNITLNKEKLFFELFGLISDQSLFVIKGIQDFHACNNTLKLFDDDIVLNFDSYYDIETFNGLSSQLYESSQLETTYKNIIKTKIYKQFAKRIFDRIIFNVGEKAHNPVTDSLFTVIVAVTVNIGLIMFFEK